MATPLHHVVLSVSDLERSLSFYTQVLGYRKTLESPVEGERYERYLKLTRGSTGRMAMLQADERTLGMIELVQFDPAWPATHPKRFGDPGATMIAIELENETVEDVLARLAEMGTQPWSDVTQIDLEGYPPFRCAIIEDPDGFLIELVQLPSPEEVKAFRARYKARQPESAEG